jgi:formylglycine-generating enzyme required for sulfatase activity
MNKFYKIIFAILLISFILSSGNTQARPRRIKTKDNAYMRLIRGGRFYMGSKYGKCEEKPIHKVRVKSFYMDEKEVTFAKYKNFLKKSGYSPEGNWKSAFKKGYDNHPVVNVTLKDAKAYAKWAGKRLPTEEEWEYSAGGPRRYVYSWGNGWNRKAGALWDPRRKTSVKTGSYRPNGYGLYDMTGNVMEWTKSTFLPYPGKRKKCANMDGNFTVVKGGCYLFFADRSRRQARHAVKPGISFPAIGFRCAKDL